MTTGTITIGGTESQTGAISIGTGTGTQTINLGTGGTGTKTINLGTGAGANIVTIGSTTGTASTALRSGTGNITFSNATTEMMRITSSGNIGIGTTTPSTMLEIYGGDVVVYRNSTNTGSAVLWLRQMNHSQGNNGSWGLAARNTPVLGVYNQGYGGDLMTFYPAGYVRIGNSGTPGNATGAGDLYVASDIEYDGVLYGPGADVAERITATEEGLGPGTVVELDPEAREGVRRSRGAYSVLVAGVISTEPGIILGKESGGVALAISGRVPVRANTENGAIAVGDLLTTSSVPGEAMACRDPERCFGAVLGKAMEPLTESAGTIVALVVLG